MSTSSKKRQSAKKRGYQSSLRRAQAEQTREQIVEAAYLELQKVPLHDLSYAVLAETLGISPRTIYRHFPHRNDLGDAVLRKHRDRLLGPGERPKTLPEAAALMRRVHHLLEDEPGTYRLFFHLPLHSQVGVQRLVESVWEDVLSSLPEGDRSAAAGVFELFMGPYAYDVLHGNWGLSARETTRVCLAVLDLIAKGLERDPSALSSDRIPSRFDDGLENE